MHGEACSLEPIQASLLQVKILHGLASIHSLGMESGNEGSIGMYESVHVSMTCNLAVHNSYHLLISYLSLYCGDFMKSGYDNTMIMFYLIGNCTSCIGHSYRACPRPQENIHCLLRTS